MSARYLCGKADNVSVTRCSESHTSSQDHCSQTQTHNTFSFKGKREGRENKQKLAVQKVFPYLHKSSAYSWKYKKLVHKEPFGNLTWTKHWQKAFRLGELSRLNGKEMCLEATLYLEDYF